MALANQTIVLKGHLSERAEEKTSTAVALSPGHLLMETSAGLVQKNTLVAGNIPILVAKEDALQGKTISDAYAVSTTIFYHVAQKGDVLNLRVPAAAAAIVKGDRLEPVSGGTVQKLASGVALFVAEEAVDNSGGGSEVFIQARVI